MKISDAKIFVGGPGKNYVTLKVLTDQGESKSKGNE
jgi:mannonate dehydratase